MRSIILASSSPYRLGLLRAAGLEPEVVAPEVDESFPEAADASAEEWCLRLSRIKALWVSRRRPEALVIGSDQVMELDGCLVGKVDSADAARQRLLQMSATTHRFCSGVVVALAQQVLYQHVGVAKITFHRLSSGEIEAHIASGEWRGIAGCYKIESAGIRFVSKLEGDYFSVIGMPVIELLTFLRQQGHSA